MANSTHRFSISSIPVYVRNLTSIQKQFLDQAWNFHVSFGTPFPLRSLPSIFGKQSLVDAFKGLNGSLVYETTEQDGRGFKLTIYGALLTGHGPVLASLLVRLLDLVKNLYEKDNFIRELDNSQIMSQLALAESEINILFRFLTLGLPSGIPFHLSSYAPDGSRWNITITDDVINLYNADGSASYLDSLLSSGYRPDEPYSQSERLKYQAPHLDNFLQGVKKAKSLNIIGNKPSVTVSASIVDNVDEQQIQEGTNSITHTQGKTKASPKPDSSSQALATSALSATRTEAEAVFDYLGRERLATALHRILTEREDDHPFAIGLFGHWGTGKSSQINFLQEELKKTGKPEIMVAEFNAWQNEKATNLAAMMAQSVVDGLMADKGIWEKLKLAVKQAALRHSHSRKAIEKDWRSLTVWLSWAWMLLPPAASLLILASILWWMPFSDNLVASLLKGIAIPTALVAAYHSISHFMRNHLTEWFKKLDMKKSISLFALPDYSSHRGLTLDIHHTLRDLCSLCLKGQSPKEGQYLLLVIDDLDRCGVDTVKDVLDAVRLVASIPRVVTLVAIDERMAFAAVEKHYLQFGHAGRSPAQVARDYLAKVLQVSVTLPEVDSSGISNYVDNMIFGDIVSTKSQENQKGDLSFSTQTTIRQQVGSAKVNPLLTALKESFEDINQTATIQIPPQQSSLPQEKEMFKELAKTYEFSNPRLLWRHYMAWKLLKSLSLGSTYNLADIEMPMQLIFWREWLHQLTSEQREAYSEWMKAGGQSKPPGMSDAIFDTVKLKLRPNWNAHLSLIRVVDAVLLPTNPCEDASHGKKNKIERSTTDHDSSD